MNHDQLMDDVLLFLSSSSSFGLFPYREQYSILLLRTIIVMNLGNLLCAFIIAFFLYIMKKKKQHYATRLHKLQKRKPSIRDR